MTTAGPPSDLQRVMTIARSFPDEAQRTQLSFLFTWAMEELPEEERLWLLFHPDIEACLGPTYFGALVPCHCSRWARYYTKGTARPTHENPQPRAFMINAFPHFLPTATEVDSEVIYLRHHHVVHRLSIAEIMDRCYHLHKLMGCSECPRRGYQCILDHHGKEPNHVWHQTTPQLVFPFLDRFTLPVPGEFTAKCFDLDDWRDLKLKSWEGQFAGYTVVPPLATARDPTMPGTPALRVPYEHNFFKLETARDDLSARAAAGVETRRTRREECSKCFFGGKTSYRGHETVHPCHKYAPRWCKHGAWTEEQLVKTTLEYVDAGLHRTNFTLDDLWLVANVAGIPFPKRDPDTGRNREWIISRLDAHGEMDQVRVIARRTSRACRYETVELTTRTEVYAFLSKGTKLVWDEAKKKTRDDDQLALWLQLAFLSHGKSYSFYWSAKKGDKCGFDTCSPMVGCVQLHSYGACVELWLSRERRNVHLGDFKEVMDRYDTLPLFNAWSEHGEILRHPSLYARV